MIFYLNSHNEKKKFKIFRDLFTYTLKDSLEKYINPITYPTPEERKERSPYLCKFILDFLYYGFSSVFIYI